MTRRIYIAGPMSGYELFNYPAFHDAEERLTDLEEVITNPARNFDGRTDLLREVYIAKAVAQVAESDILALLPGWENSPGAKLEVRVAQQTGGRAFSLECILDPHWRDDECSIRIKEDGEIVWPLCAVEPTEGHEDQYKEAMHRAFNGAEPVDPTGSPSDCLFNGHRAKDCVKRVPAMAVNTDSTPYDDEWWVHGYCKPDHVFDGKCWCKASGAQYMKEHFQAAVKYYTERYDVDHTGDEFDNGGATITFKPKANPDRSRSRALEWSTVTPSAFSPEFDGECSCTTCNEIVAGKAMEGLHPDSVRAQTLDEAKRLVTGDRNAQYGPPTQDFSRTADMLTAIGYRLVDPDGSTHALQPSDVAIVMVQLKTSRLMHSRGKRDSWIDLAGYAACGAECAEEADK